MSFYLETDILSSEDGWDLSLNALFLNNTINQNYLTEVDPIGIKKCMCRKKKGKVEFIINIFIIKFRKKRY